MADSFDFDVVIIGAGPAGLCAAMYAGRSMLNAVLIERGASGGELLNTELIEDYPGFEKIEGWDLAQRFESHAIKFGAQIHRRAVESVKKQPDGSFETLCDDGTIYRSTAVIVTAGGTPVKLGVPGELEYAGKGVSYCAICDGAFFKQMVLAVVGGGDAAAEESDFLTRYASKVYLIHRRDELRASKILQQRVFDNPKIEVVWNTVVERIEGDDRGLVNNLALRDVITGEERGLAVDGIFIFIGFKPNTGIIADHIEHDESGYIVTDSNMETSVRGLFAAGDLRAQLTRQVTTAVGDATTAAIAVEKYLTALRDGETSPRIQGTGGYAV